MSTSHYLPGIPVACAMVLLMNCGCSTKRHFTSWPGAFFIDSSTVGLLCEQWDEEQSGTGVWRSYEESDVKSSFYKYDLEQKELVWQAETPHLGGTIYFAAPWLLCVSDGDLCMFNVQSFEAKVIRGSNGKQIGALGISKNAKYVFYQIADTQFAIYDVASNYESAIFARDSVPFFIDEVSGDAYLFVKKNIGGNVLKYNFQSAKCESLSAWNIMTIRRSIDYGNAILINATATPGTMAFFLTSHISDEPLPFTEFEFTYVGNNIDIDLSTGNCVFGNCDIYLENIYVNGNRQVIASSEIREE